MAGGGCALRYLRLQLLGPGRRLRARPPLPGPREAAGLGSGQWDALPLGFAHRGWAGGRRRRWVCTRPQLLLPRSPRVPCSSPKTAMPTRPSFLHSHTLTRSWKLPSSSSPSVRAPFCHQPQLTEIPSVGVLTMTQLFPIVL